MSTAVGEGGATRSPPRPGAVVAAHVIFTRPHFHNMHPIIKKYILFSDFRQNQTEEVLDDLPGAPGVHQTYEYNCTIKLVEH